jgi:hypothetical protein
MLTLLSLLDARLDDTGVCVSATLQHLEVLPSVAPGRSRTSVSTDLSTTLAMPTKALQKPPWLELWRFYLSALQCESFTVVRQHRVEVAGTRTDFTLLLLGDEEAIQRELPVNQHVTDALADTGYGNFYGDALIVCLHAVGEDGDDTNLADVGLIYEAIGKNLPTPWTAEKIADVRNAPLKGRVLELLGLFDLE